MGLVFYLAYDLYLDREESFWLLPFAINPDALNFDIFNPPSCSASDPYAELSPAAVAA